jgi:hypothetical protein
MNILELSLINTYISQLSPTQYTNNKQLKK